MNNEPIIKKSKYNNNLYTMYNCKIIITNGNQERIVELPRDENSICFYDMYYERGLLIVIIATRGEYDLKYELDEDNLKLQKISYTK